MEPLLNADARWSEGLKARNVTARGNARVHRQKDYLVVPDDATIKKVKQQITAARREAHALLEKAKQAVEIAIEKNEMAGMAVLNG